VAEKSLLTDNLNASVTRPRNLASLMLFSEVLQKADAAKVV